MSLKPWLSVAGLVAAALLSIGAAADPSDRLPNPVQEARARHLFQQLRCVVCQNESIDDSEADIASDLRRIVRGQIAAGRSDAQVRAFLVQRYGEFILLKPPLTPGNAVLWLAPAALILVGGAYLWGQSHRSPAAAEPALTAQEELALGALSAGLPDTDPPHGGPSSDSVVPHFPGAKPGH